MAHPRSQHRRIELPVAADRVASAHCDPRGASDDRSRHCAIAARII